MKTATVTYTDGRTLPKTGPVAVSAGSVFGVLG
jgi:hypothetical protein